jgi:hAT family C-terminal dimerisation region
LLALYTLD